MISTLVILGLVLVWGIVLLPDLASKVSRVRRSDPIRSFNTQLSSLGRSAPVHRGDNVIDLRSRGSETRRSLGSVTSEPPRVRPASVGYAPDTALRPVSAAVRKRRQDVVLALGAAVLLTLLATVAFSGVFLYLNLVADILLAAYLIALQRVGNARPAPAAARRSTGTLAASDVGSSGIVSQPFEPRRVAN